MKFGENCAIVRTMPTRRSPRSRHAKTNQPFHSRLGTCGTFHPTQARPSTVSRTISPAICRVCTIVAPGNRVSARSSSKYRSCPPVPSVEQSRGTCGPKDLRRSLAKFAKSPPKVHASAPPLSISPKNPRSPSSERPAHYAQKLQKPPKPDHRPLHTAL